MIGQNGPNMGVAGPQAPMGGWWSMTPSKVWSWVLVNWATAISRRTQVSQINHIRTILSKLCVFIIIIRIKSKCLYVPLNACLYPSLGLTA